MEVYQSSKTAAEMEYALSAVPSIGENGNWFIGEQDTGVFAGGVDVTGAKVGQIIKVSEVDDTGRPTVWEAVDGVDKPWTQLAAITLDEPIYSVDVTKDMDGNPISLNEIMIRGFAITGDTNTGANFFVNDVMVMGGIQIASSPTYFTPFDFFVAPFNGRFRAECIISSLRATTATYAGVGTGSANVASCVLFSPASKITSIKVTCSYYAAHFGVGSVFEFYGR